MSEQDGAYGLGADPARRPDWNREQHILYMWDRDQLPRIRKGGVLSTSRPSPLTRAQIEPVLLALAACDEYDGQTIICHDENFTEVVLRDGDIQPA